MGSEKRKPGPKPERLKLEGKWKDRLRDALKLKPEKVHEGAKKAPKKRG